MRTSTVTSSDRTQRDHLMHLWRVSDVRSFEQIRDNYPGIDDTDIRACIAYGAEMSRERYVDLPVSSLP